MNSKKILVALIIIMMMVQTVSASTTLYEYYSTNDDNWVDTSTSARAAQTFTVGSTAHTVTIVSMKVGRFDFPGNAIIAIRAVDGSNHPTGSNLTVWVGDTQYWPALGNGEWRNFTMSPEYTLSANTKYALQLYCQNAPSGKKARWRCDATSPSYSGGCWEWSTNSGSTWTSYTTVDMMFKIYGDIPAVPSVSISKTGPTEVNIGETITYEYVVTNDGDTELHDVNIDDNVTGTRSMTGTLDPDETWEFTMTYTAGTTTPLVNNVTVYAESPAHTEYTDWDTHSVTIIQDTPNNVDNIEETQRYYMFLGGLLLIMYGLTKTAFGISYNEISMVVATILLGLAMLIGVGYI